MALELGRDEARQLAVRAQLLDATRPTDLVDLVDRLTLLQIDPTAAMAPTGWTNNRNVTQMLELLSASGGSRSPDGSDGNGSGTSLTASTRASSLYPPTKHNAAESNDGSVRSASLAPRPPPCRESRSR